MKKNQKIKKIILSTFVVLPILLVLNIYSSVPGTIHLTEQDSYTTALAPFCSVTTKSPTLAASKTANGLVVESDNKLHINTSSTGDYQLSLKLFDRIPLKTIHVSVTPKTYVVPCGVPVGVKLYTQGLLVISIADVTTEDGTTYAPGKDAGLKEGDRILAVNGKTVSSTEDFSALVNNQPTALTLSIARNDETFDVSITPVLSKNDNKYKLGIWVRDSTAGVGTLTFYNPIDSSFAALGHAITDVDTGNIMTVNKGSILSCKILSITKAKNGTPGELTGSFSNNQLGTIQKNNALGIYGTIENAQNLIDHEPVPVATRFQTKEGPASILADVNGQGVREYAAEIESVSKSDTVNNKGIILRITDPVLLAETGGIVQGMSGSPILQNGKLVGAVTHVFVNDPERGYGIFIENMLQETANNQ